MAEECKATCGLCPDEGDDAGEVDQDTDTDAGSETEAGGDTDDDGETDTGSETEAGGDTDDDGETDTGSETEAGDDTGAVLNAACIKQSKVLGANIRVDGSNYLTVDFDECLDQCDQTEGCKSIEYNFEASKCQLNKRLLDEAIDGVGNYEKWTYCPARD